MIFSKRLLVQILLFPTAFCLLLFTIYWPGLHGNFIFDDFPNIVNNTSLHAFDGSLQSLIAAAISGTSSPLGRPLSMASFALNFHFFGDAPFSFKLTNLIIHFANAMLVFTLARQLSRRLGHDTSTTQSLAPAIWLAASWALHPINATPVLFIVQRMSSLSAFFAFSALSLYLYGREKKNRRGNFAIVGSILVFWPAAIFSKETGLLLPIYLFLCEWLLLGSFRTVSAKTKWFAVVLIGSVSAGLCWSKWGFITAGYGVRDFDLAERLMTETRVLWFYLRQLFLPTPSVFSLFHDDIPISRGLLTPPETLFAIVGWLAVAALALQQRARRPLFVFAVFWFLASHLLESTALPLEIAYEHRNYIASFGIFLWAALLLFPAQKSAQWRIPKLTLAVSFVFFCALVTGIRSLQWADEFQRTQIEATDHPDSARANYEAARVVMQRTFESGNGSPLAYHMVNFHLNRAGALDKNSKSPLIGLLYLNCAAGLPKDIAIQTSLRERFSSTRFSFADRAVVQSLSDLLLERRLCLDSQEVKQLIEAGLSNPSADGLMRGMIYAVAMDYAAAIAHSIPQALAYAQAAVANDPDNVAFRINLIHLYIQSSKADDAKREFNALANRHVSLRDKLSLDELKNIFEAMEKNAHTR